MNILLICRYFWPEAPHLGDMELAIATALTEDGHEVVVFTSSSTYIGKQYAAKSPRRSEVHGVRIIRSRLPKERRSVIASRLLNEILFTSQLAVYVLRHGRRFDALYTNTTPPFASGVVAALSTRVFGTPYVRHVWDVHPEIDAYAGKLSRGILFRLLRRLDSWICRESSLTVTLSTDMASELEDRGNVGDVAVITNFAAGTEPRERTPRTDRSGLFTIAFTGNLGKYQGLDAVIEAAALLLDDDVQFDFYGVGSEKSSLRRLADGTGAVNVHFHDHTSLDEVMGILSECDLALLPLAPDIHRFAHPSKLPVYLQAGCRILAVVDGDSELAQFTRASATGTVADPGNPDSIASAIRQEMARFPADGIPTTDEFDRVKQLNRWRDAFRSLNAGV